MQGKWPAYLHNCTNGADFREQHQIVEFRAAKNSLRQLLAEPGQEVHATLFSEFKKEGGLRGHTGQPFANTSVHPNTGAFQSCSSPTSA